MRTFDDPHCEINAQLIRSLHYIMINYDLTKMPGQWRLGQVFVIREENKEQVYEGPDADTVPELMTELLEQITSEDRTASIVKSAMAHLNLTMIHPFKDGNGRMARALQTLVLSRDRILSPVFCSIEEWLGRNTAAYYEVLGRVGQGHWNPDHDARPWLRFCLVAHYQQAATLIKRNEEMGRVWDGIEKITDRLRLPDRMQTALIDAAFGYRVRNNKYRLDHELSEVVASRDLKKLCDLDLLSPVGEKRGRFYVAAEPIKALRAKSRDNSRAADPYALVQKQTRLVTPPQQLVRQSAPAPARRVALRRR
jgi:Fic family protein